MKKTVPLLRTRKVFRVGLIVLLISVDNAQIQQSTITSVSRKAIECAHTGGDPKRYTKSEPRILLAEELYWIRTVVLKFDGSKNLMESLVNDVAKACDRDSIILLSYMYSLRMENGQPILSTPNLANQFLKNITIIKI